MGGIDQTKGETNQPAGGQISVKSLIAGFVTQGTDSSPVDYTRINDLGYMSVGRYAPGTGIVLDVKGKTSGTKGTIRALRLAHSMNVNVPICASLTGGIGLCGESLEYNTVKNSQGVDESGIYSLVIPPGVSSLQVTLRGAGGAGYGEKNIETYKDDGDASFFVGENASFIANGGRGAESFSVPGVGGQAVASVSVTASAKGGDGGNPPSFTGTQSVLITGPCNSTNFYLVKGGSGNTGGKGGAPYQGSQATGGTGGPGGPTAGTAWNFTNGSGESMGTYLNCSEVYNTSDTHQSGSEENNRIGGNGVDGALGAGGSGFGGQGGESALADASDCSNFSNPLICKGGDSVAGGGAGAYINATINVNQGEIFYIKTGRGGIPQYSTCNGSLYDIMACKKSKRGGGAISGKGGHGQVLVQFNYF